MGSFSWLKADKLTKVANVAYGAPFKFLIPEVYGGGFIKDKYQDYGKLGTKPDGSARYDVYELLAFWNSQRVRQPDGCVVYLCGGKPLKFKGDFPKMKERDEFTNYNRGLGIDIGCYNNQINALNFPLKFVSASYTGTYEECEGKSYGDPMQGFGTLTRLNYARGRY